jgi:hypothetical protein
VIFASFSAVASESARARPASDRSGSAAIVGLLGGAVSARSACRTRKIVGCAAAGAALRTATSNARTIHICMIRGLKITGDQEIRRSFCIYFLLISCSKWPRYG